MPKTLFMESTEISAEKTAGEITSLLIQCGARQITMAYDPVGRITDMCFVLHVAGVAHPFKMPVRVAPVFKILNGRRRYEYDRTANAVKDLAQAERVAWRQLFRWVQAQLALVDAGMAAAREVFSPYLLDDATGRTLFEFLEGTRFKALPAAEAS